MCMDISFLQLLSLIQHIICCCFLTVWIASSSCPLLPTVGAGCWCSCSCNISDQSWSAGPCSADSHELTWGTFRIFHTRCTHQMSRCYGAWKERANISFHITLYLNFYLWLQAVSILEVFWKFKLPMTVHLVKSFVSRLKVETMKE